MDKSNVRLIDVVEMYVAEYEKNKEIKEEYEYVMQENDNLLGIDKILEKSNERLEGFKSWVEIKNSTDEEFRRLVETITNFRQGYKNRLVHCSKRNIMVWTKESVKTEMKRRYDAGLSLRVSQIAKVDAGLGMAMHRMFGKSDDLCVELFGMTITEYEKWVR